MFFGREEQLEQLKTLLSKRSASLVTCRGRRRIGKSTLIEFFAERFKCRFIKIEGRRPQQDMSNEDELTTFAQQLSWQAEAEKTPPSCWMDAFRRLNSQINDDEMTVVLLDEISWLAHYDKCFADDLKIAWDNLFKKHSRLILVLCGSVSSWLRDNIIDNSAYLGRRSLDLIVKELPLKDCVKFWGKAASRIDAREIIDVLSVTGGIPRYLEEINPSLSAADNIRRLCFLPNSVLRADFDEMFRDVITTEQTFSGNVLRALANGSKTGAEIAQELKLEKNGRTASVLARLVEAGLVSADVCLNPETGKKAREIRYRLKDNYSRFYLKYIEPMKSIIDAGAFDLVTLEALEGIDAVMGLAFENLVVNNYRELLNALNLNGTIITSAAPYRRNTSNGKR
ncbi:MAG: ATP-binding protein, partial [Victivallales bacterium]|nr:ATP-binding protein [Victivallales bacterium]